MVHGGDYPGLESVLDCNVPRHFTFRTIAALRKILRFSSPDMPYVPKRKTGIFAQLLEQVWPSRPFRDWLPSAATANDLSTSRRSRFSWLPRPNRRRDSSATAHCALSPPILPGWWQASPSPAHRCAIGTFREEVLNRTRSSRFREPHALLAQGWPERVAHL